MKEFRDYKKDPFYFLIEEDGDEAFREYYGYDRKDYDKLKFPKKKSVKPAIEPDLSSFF